jgi:chromosome segregation ATPase
MSRDTGRDTRDTPHDMPPSDSSALISAKDETISTLRDQLEAERQAHAEARRIIAGLVERIPPAIREAPQEPTEAAETVEEAPEGAGPHSAAGEAQDELGTERARREMAETTLREGMAEERRRREQAERERDDLRQELEAITRARRESPQTVEEASEGASPWSATGEAQERAQRPWWRRIIGR